MRLVFRRSVPHISRPEAPNCRLQCSAVQTVCRHGLPGMQSRGTVAGGRWTSPVVSAQHTEQLLCRLSYSGACHSRGTCRRPLVALVTAAAPSPASTSEWINRSALLNPIVGPTAGGAQLSARCTLHVGCTLHTALCHTSSLPAPTRTAEGDISRGAHAIPQLAGLSLPRYTSESFQGVRALQLIWLWLGRTILVGPHFPMPSLI